MQDAHACGIPDIQLTGQDGKTVNPSDFAGHDLVMLLCPADQEEAKRELASYNALADALAYNDAYMIAVCGAQAGPPASRITICADAGRAWDAVEKCLDGKEQLSPHEGAVLLFGRGGCLRKVWRGVGHSRKVADALGDRM